ncbi:MAG: homoserine O-acetyltransferase [Dehalococcoidia bacterium]|nr:homoserine O-acetyltransferase [Dehalococcoidia bacterium]PWB43780.1 MAG: homoserine O-acetyltransferase [Dehalococcoidia bacterium]
MEHTVRQVAPIGDLPLECGNALRGVEVAYELYGHMSPAADNVVLVCHALTGSAGAGGPAGWWEPLIGRGRAIDTDRYAVLCSNILGSCYGTTGPTSINPATGRKYGAAFPEITVGDMVAAQRALVRDLGITRLASVAGGSLGGLQVLEWAAQAPEMVGSIIPIGCGIAHQSWQIAFNEVARQAIRTDPAWNCGSYTDQPTQGMALARMIAMISYRSAESFQGRFGRARGRGEGGRGQFDVAGYLYGQGDKLVRRFDANAYMRITTAMDGFDVGAGRGGAVKALAAFTGPALVMGIDSDVLYPVADQLEIAGTLRENGNQVEYREIASMHGHDAFLMEWDQLTEEIGPFLVRAGG